MKKFFIVIILLNFFTVCISLSKKEILEDSSYPQESSKDIKKSKFYEYEQTNQNIVTKQSNIVAKDQNIYNKRQIIYESYANIQVKKINSALDTIKSIVDNNKGYIESSSIDEKQASAYVKIRVPVEKFFYVLDEIFKIGRVISHSITAEDVSKKLHDVQSRLNTLNQLRNRLYELFKKAQNVEEKAKILKEINRLTTEIENLEARQKYLKDKATYSTIEISLFTKEKDEGSPLYDSPFQWIKKLDPLNRTIFNDDILWNVFFKTNITLKEVFESIKIPSTFFDNKNDFIEKNNLYAFYTPSGSGIRVGIVQNEPLGDINFWLKALKEEFNKRNYDIIQKDEQLHQEIKYLHLKINDGIKQYYYTVGVFLKKENIIVIEIFYPGEDDFNKYNKIIKELL